MSTYGLSVLGADLKSLARTAQAADAAGWPISSGELSKSSDHPR